MVWTSWRYISPLKSERGSTMASNRCVNCGMPVEYLFTEYGQENFVLEMCSSCKRFTDPYIEQSSIILVLDLFLLKPQVYYHLLFNTNHSFQSFHSQLPAQPTQVPNSNNSATTIPSNLINPFNRKHPQFPFVIYSLILLLESCFQALDDLHPDDSFLQLLNPHRQILEKLVGLVFHIFNLVFTATTLSRFIRPGARYNDCPTPAKQVVLNAIQGIIISLFPGIALCFTIIIFQNSYGTRSPPPLLSPTDSVYVSQLISLLQTRLGYDITGIFDGLVGIDMDQLGSTKLKQFLIRNFLGSLSCSVGIAVSFSQSWSYGFLVLACCSIQKRLLAYLFHQLLYVLPA